MKPQLDPEPGFPPFDPLKIRVLPLKLYVHLDLHP
jgi:hypothetical protein